MCVLDALGDVGPLVDEVGFHEALVDIADMAVELGDDIAGGVLDARFRTLVVNHRRARCHRLLGVEHRGQHLVIDHEPPAAFLRGGLAVGDDGGDPLADEAHDIVENDGVGGIVLVALVACGGEPSHRRVFPGDDRDDSLDRERVLLADRQDAGMGVR